MSEFESRNIPGTDKFGRQSDEHNPSKVEVKTTMLAHMTIVTMLDHTETRTAYEPVIDTSAIIPEEPEP